MKEEDYIEHFFKSRLSDKRQFDFQESDWAKMEAKLDDAGMFPTIGFFESLFSKIWFWILAALILALVFGWYANDTFRVKFDVQKSKTIEIQKTTNAIDNQSEVNLECDTAELVENSIPSEVNAMNNEAALCDSLYGYTTTDNRNNIIISESNKTLKTDNNGSKQKATVLANSITTDLDELLIEDSDASEETTLNENLLELENNQLSESKETNEPSQKSKEENIINKTILLVKNDIPTVKRESESDNDAVINHPSTSDLDFISSKPVPSFFKNKGVVQLSYKQVSQEVLASKSRTKDSLESNVSPHNPYSRLAVGLSYAPDANSVGFAERLSVTNRFSFQLYYRLASRFSISSGVAYSKKKYVTTGEHYSPPAGYWGKKTNGILPDDIEGICSVIDIPLNVTYTWNPGQRFRILSTIGISNYILLDENYQYEYDVVNPNADTEWVTDENSKVYLGLMNFSFAAAWNINNKLEFQVEPYLKAPIKKIGFGNVSLYSSGIYFTLKIKFLSRKKKYGIIRTFD